MSRIIKSWKNTHLNFFKKGTELAAARKLILVDTKYEFGKHNGNIYLIDEVHTPDSSQVFLCRWL